MIKKDISKKKLSRYIRKKQIENFKDFQEDILTIPLMRFIPKLVKKT